MTTNTPLVLIILDGWGYRTNATDNAIATAETPQWNAWWQTRPHILLDASGSTVGLPEQQMGNSEVGHMHIGAGRRILQELTHINEAIADGYFVQNKIFLNLINNLQHSNKTLHIMGLCSAGGVHSHENHLFALLKLCIDKKFFNIKLHLFLDGRDVSPQCALDSIHKLTKLINNYPQISIASLTGRYFAMDRNNNWDRISATYNLLTNNDSKYNFADAEQAINYFYQQKIFDEFIPPTMLSAFSPVQDGDAILFFNFRADRARQLTATFCNPAFNKFPRLKMPVLSSFVSMTPYEDNTTAISAFKPAKLTQTLGEIVAAHGLRQLRIAETEKYAHVTFFFNGGVEQTFPQEERILIPSPAVATYDLKPEMSAPQITDSVINAIMQQKYDFIICNYANADMVGHTGNLPATIKAINCLDLCLQRLGEVIAKTNGALLITADHGNAELMYDPDTKQPHTAHTNEKVPLLFIGNKKWQFTQKEGSLIDIAPTILKLLALRQPEVMTGTPLLAKN